MRRNATCPANCGLWLPLRGGRRHSRMRSRGLPAPAPTAPHAPSLDGIPSGHLSVRILASKPYAGARDLGRIEHPTMSSRGLSPGPIAPLASSVAGGPRARTGEPSLDRPLSLAAPHATDRTALSNLSKRPSRSLAPPADGRGAEKADVDREIGQVLTCTEGYGRGASETDRQASDVMGQ